MFIILLKLKASPYTKSLQETAPLCFYFLEIAKFGGFSFGATE